MNKKTLWYLLIALFLIFFDRVIGMEGVKSNLHRFFSPLQVGMVRARLWVNDGVDFVVSLPVIYRENISYREELLLCQETTVTNLDLVQEKEALLKQLKISSYKNWEVEMVKVVGLAEYDNEERLLIQGKFGEGQVLVSGKELIGEIVLSGGLRSQVRTVFSPQSRIPVKVVTENGPVEALAEGEYTSGVYLSGVLVDKKIKVGDLVVTSGAAGKFPSNLLIGTVKEVSELEGDVYKRVSLQIPWSMRNLAYAFIIKE